MFEITPRTAANVAIVLLIVRWISQLGLEWLNTRNVLDHAGDVPESFRNLIDPAAYKRSVQYTLAKSRFRCVELTCDLAVLFFVLFSGFLPAGLKLFAHAFGSDATSMASFLFVSGLFLTITSLPFDWYAQFHLEEHFGFNTTTPKVWWLDRGKGVLLAAVLGYPLLVLILVIVQWTGSNWWLWAWAVVLGFQFLVVLLAPVFILPLFNKFSPLPEGTLRQRLLELADRTKFRASSIQVMDGSKRSRHSNAFFTGFGRFRKIVLFDTLIQHLAEVELEAVLAHEIGHFKKKHIPKMLLWGAATQFVGFFVLARLARQDWFYTAFGFQPGNVAVALLLFALPSGIITFWFTPIANLWSRRFEYQADAFAAKVMKESVSLICALRKLNEKNLSNLTPHPIYSGFYYSHPTLLEREDALLKASN